MGEGSYNSILEYILLDSIASNIYFTPTCHLKKLILEKKKLKSHHNFLYRNFEIQFLASILSMGCTCLLGRLRMICKKLITNNVQNTLLREVLSLRDYKLNDYELKE